MAVLCGSRDDNESWLNAHIRDGSELSRAKIKREITAASPPTRLRWQKCQFIPERLKKQSGICKDLITVALITAA